MKIYLGGPMFDEADITYNLALAQELRKNGYEVYCPNENLLINDKTRAGITPEEIYQTDIEEMLDCNIFLCRIFDDAGTMWEAGYMDCLSHYFRDKYYGCIGLTTDIRWHTLPDSSMRKADNQAFYFNGFAVGGLKLSLGICYSIEELIVRLNKFKCVMTQKENK